MPFVFGIVGILLIVSGVRGQSQTLFSLLKSDFSGQPNYFEWMVAIFFVGAIGYVKELSTISRMFMFLVLAGLLYQNKQVFTELKTEETATPAPSTTTATTPTQIASNSLPSLPSLASLESVSDDLSI